jgi:hypothetical protein
MEVIRDSIDRSERWGSVGNDAACKLGRLAVEYSRQAHLLTTPEIGAELPIRLPIQGTGFGGAGGDRTTRAVELSRSNTTRDGQTYLLDRIPKPSQRGSNPPGGTRRSWSGSYGVLPVLKLPIPLPILRVRRRTAEPAGGRQGHPVLRKRDGSPLLGPRAIIWRRQVLRGVCAGSRSRVCGRCC